MSKITKFILGPTKQFTLEERLFNFNTFASSAFMLIIIPMIFIYNDGIKQLYSFIGVCVSAVLFITLFILSRFREVKKYLIWGYLFASLLLVNIYWFRLAGISGSMPMAILWVTVLTSAMFKRTQHGFFVVIMTINYLTLVLLEYSHPEWVIPYDGNWGYIDMSMIGIFSIIGLVTIISSFKKGYQFEKVQLEEANELLQESKKLAESKSKSLEELNKELEKAKEEAIANANAKSDFLSMMSHEIRTPMNAVVGMSNILLLDNPRDDQREKLETLKFASSNLQVLINDILDFSKIEAGKIAIEEIDFDLYRLVYNIIDSLSTAASNKQIRLDFKWDDKMPKLLKGDPTRISQVITNLVSNAVKFTNEGKVEVEVKMRNYHKQSCVFEVVVCDTGIGISKEDQEKIFESFEQANPSVTRQFGGTGLGLSISTRLLELMDSRIQLKSDLGEGACFSFVMDLAFKNSLSEKEQESPEIDWKLLQGKKILLAEDFVMNFKVAEAFFKRWGVEYIWATNGEEAVEKLEQHPEIDIVLMDLHMPVMNGYEATLKIRNHPEKAVSDTPIIALTASAMIGTKDDVMSKGMNAYIPKPFNPEDLFSTICKTLGL